VINAPYEFAAASATCDEMKDLPEGEYRVVENKIVRIDEDAMTDAQRAEERLRKALEAGLAYR